MRKSIVFLFLWLWAVMLHAGDNPGKELFRNRCAKCHKIDRKFVGPALKDIHSRRSEAWLKEYIRSPKTMATHDADAKALLAEYSPEVMPDQSLTDEEMDALLAYLAAPDTAKKGETVNPGTPVNPDNKGLGSEIAILILVAIFLIGTYFASILNKILRTVSGIQVGDISRRSYTGILGNRRTDEDW